MKRFLLLGLRRLLVKGSLIGAFASIALATASGRAFAAVEPLQRTEILSRGQGGLGFSYYWGHGSWSPGLASSAPGTCAGSCPNCTHTGRYGADCSGFVCKAWVMPSTNSDLTVDQHPYSTADLINSKPGYWTPVAESEVRPGDARVYRTSTSGHTYLIREITGAGRYTTLEAKGCSYGILSTARTDAWITQRRALVVEPAAATPDVPEVPAGATSTWAALSNPYCTRATSATAGLVTDIFVVRSADKVVVQTVEAAAAQAGAEMCVRITFAAAGTFSIAAKAKNDAGSSAESAALAVVVSGGPSDGGVDGGPADGGADAGADAGGDAGHDAGSPDAGQPDGGLDAGDEGDGPGTGTVAPQKGCGCNGSSDAGVLSLLGLGLWSLSLRRRRGR